MMTIDLRPLNYRFQHKPLLIGGKAMEWYGLRPAGADIDFVVSRHDYAQLAAQYPAHTRDLFGDLGVCVDPFELWTSILLFDYDFLTRGAHELDAIKIITLEKLLFLKTLASAEPKYAHDVTLIVQKIHAIQYGKDPDWTAESLRSPRWSYNGLPTKRMAAGALIRNAQGDVLIVKPTYRTDWLVPGGSVEDHESPRQACMREVQEEIGLTLAITRLLCVEYQPEDGHRTENLQFMFDGGILDATQIAQIVLPAGELADYRFVALAEALQLLNPKLGRRVQAILQSGSQHPIYMEQGAIVS